MTASSESGESFGVANRRAGSVDNVENNQSSENGIEKVMA
jgi:hypothetical protein